VFFFYLLLFLLMCFFLYIYLRITLSGSVICVFCQN